MDKERQRVLPHETFGRNGKFLEAEGAREEIVIEAGQPSPWEQIGRFINRHRRHYIFGYVGFDLHQNQIPTLHTAPYPAAYFFVPESVREAETSGIKPIGPKDHILNPASYSNTTEQQYKEGVKETLGLIRDKVLERATVARRINLPPDVNFERADGLSAELETSRVFHLETDFVEILGNSPELLAQGTVKRFRTYKLSGTASSPSGLSDPKIRREHYGSVSLTHDSLSSIGKISYSEEPCILQLPYLSHLLTEFETRSNQGTSIADCLRATLPSGVYPYKEGLKHIAGIEPYGRGVYYGLIGVVYPNGYFEFSQVLRTIFRDKSGVYTWVGSAVTRDSIPDDEVSETIVKLGGVPRVEIITG